MEIFRVCFIGHRYIDNFNLIEKELYNILQDLIEKHEYVEFYVGKNGDFDTIVTSTIKRLQRDFDKANNSLILVLPYSIANMKYFEEFYDEILIPDLGNCHYKNAITKRNKYMVENSELLVCYVEHNFGGAYACFNKAKSIGLTIINIVDLIKK